MSPRTNLYLVIFTLRSASRALHTCTAGTRHSAAAVRIPFTFHALLAHAIIAAAAVRIIITLDTSTASDVAYVRAQLGMPCPIGTRVIISLAVAILLLSFPTDDECCKLNSRYCTLRIKPPVFVTIANTCLVQSLKTSGIPLAGTHITKI